jgi:hypothetical protein
MQQQLFSSADLTLPVYDKSQFGASSKVYTLKVYGTPKCEKPSSSSSEETCVSRYWFTLSVDTNVVSTAASAATAIREYIFSQKGSPLALSLPAHTWSTKKGDVRQSWFAFSPTGSARIIPVSNTSNDMTAGGSASLGGIAEVHFEFDATEPGTDATGSDTTYPGTLFLSVTPTIAATIGGGLNATVFQTLTPGHWIWGGEYRVGFQFKGEKPISIGIEGTYSAKGITASRNGVAFSMSKLFGAK